MIQEYHTSSDSQQHITADKHIYQCFETSKDRFDCMRVGACESENVQRIDNTACVCVCVWWDVESFVYVRQK